MRSLSSYQIVAILLISCIKLVHTCEFFTGGAGTNKQHVTTKNTAKLDRETEELKHEKVSLDLGKCIQQARQNKGFSQKDLAAVSIQT